MAIETKRLRGLVIAALGLGLVIFGGNETAEFRYRLSPNRFLIEPHNLLVTPDEEHVIVGSGRVKVQVYGPNARVATAWRIPESNAPFQLQLTPEGRVLATHPGSNAVLEYTLDGTLAREYPGAALTTSAGELGSDSAVLSGARYRLDAGRIIRTRNGEDEIFVDGFASHADMTAQMVWMGLCLFLGMTMVIGGFLSTGRRAPAPGAVPTNA